MDSVGTSTETYEDEDDGYSTLNRIKANEPGKRKEWETFGRV